jgi:hypothetical protein
MVVTGQSADALEIQVRGSPWIMDSVNLPRLVGSFDLGGRQAGWHTLRLKPDSLDLPPGIVVDRVTPDSIGWRWRLRKASGCRGNEALTFETG